MMEQVRLREEIGFLRQDLDSEVKLEMHLLPQLTNLKAIFDKANPSEGGITSLHTLILMRRPSKQINHSAALRPPFYFCPACISNA